MDLMYTLLIGVGCFFLFSATLGLFRLPDVFTRLHATTKCDTMAAGCIIAAAMLRSGSWFVAAKLLSIFIFILLVNPTTSHLIAWVATQRRADYERKTG